MSVKELAATINDIAIRGKGILAADESKPTIAKRFASIDVENNEEHRRAYRELLFTTPGMEEFISGVILFEETLSHKAADGTPFPKLLAAKGVVPGIKVDRGTIPLTNSEGDKVTQGLDGLGERLQNYKQQGARFAKWRSIYPISAVNPRRLAMQTNAEVLARYAAICQENGIVPIVEPEVLIDGDHTIERCEEVSEEVLFNVFAALHRHHVSFEHMILKPSMVIAGKSCSQQSNVDEVAKATIRVLLRTVPGSVATINFLSGGQTEQQATAHLNAMHRLGVTLPWNLSFSYARALQAPCLKTWQGKPENVKPAQEIFYKRAKLNGAASCGEYETSME